MDRSSMDGQTTGTEVAIIGMACRFPGAQNPEEFWQNLKNGVESISSLSEDELLLSGEDLAGSMTLAMLGGLAGCKT